MKLLIANENFIFIYNKSERLKMININNFLIPKYKFISI